VVLERDARIRDGRTSLVDDLPGDVDRDGGHDRQGGFRDGTARTQRLERVVGRADEADVGVNEVATTVVTSRRALADADRSRGRT
jgi:hypothetical protein